MLTTFTSMMPVGDLGTELDRVFQLAGARCGGDTVADSGFTPRANIGEEADGYFIEMDLPGVGMDQIDVSVDRRELTISGERCAADVAERTYSRHESLRGRFERVFNLPETADQGRVEALLANGVLTVRIPKAESAKARRVEVTSA
jgi:HSP20 family protein